MTLSELINKLNEAKAKYGDLTVFIQNGDAGGDYEGSREAYDKSTCVVEDDGKKIFLIS